MINVALPKGRLGEKVYKMFAECGYECPSILENNRKLIFENEEKGVRYFWVKPSDVAIYVSTGVADVGVVGKDIILEQKPDVYELLDLGFGKCRFAVAAPKDKDFYAGYETKRIASKYPKVAHDYFLSKGMDVSVINIQSASHEEFQSRCIKHSTRADNTGCRITRELKRHIGENIHGIGHNKQNRIHSYTYNILGYLLEDIRVSR